MSPRIVDRHFRSDEFVRQRYMALPLLKKCLSSRKALLKEAGKWLDEQFSEERIRKDLEEQQRRNKLRDAGSPTLPSQFNTRRAPFRQPPIPGDSLRADRLQHALCHLLAQNRPGTVQQLLGPAQPSKARERNAVRAGVVCACIVDPDAEEWLATTTKLASCPWESDESANPPIKGRAEVLTNYGFDALNVLSQCCLILDPQSFEKAQGRSEDSVRRLDPKSLPPKDIDLLKRLDLIAADGLLKYEDLLALLLRGGVAPTHIRSLNVRELVALLRATPDPDVIHLASSTPARVARRLSEAEKAFLSAIQKRRGTYGFTLWLDIPKDESLGFHEVADLALDGLIKVHVYYDMSGGGDNDGFDYGTVNRKPCMFKELELVHVRGHLDADSVNGDRAKKNYALEITALGRDSLSRSVDKDSERNGDPPEWSCYMPKMEAARILNCEQRKLEELHSDKVESKTRQSWRIRLDKCDAPIVKRYEQWLSKEKPSKKPRGKSANSRKLTQTSTNSRKLTNG